MNINHLAIFYAVAIEGSVSRGAERLHISQPAVSKQLRELERSLGMALFYRLSRGVQLTDSGELLLGYARQIFELEKQAEQALAELRGLERGRLRIGASTTVGAYLLPGALAEFQRRYPRIELILEIANASAIQRRLLEHTLDLAFIGGPVEHDELQGDVLCTDEIVLIAHASHPWRERGAVAPEEIAAAPLLLREAGSGSRAAIEQAFAERGIALHPAMSLGSTEALKQAAAAGSGLAFVSERVIADELAGKLFVRLPIRELKIECPVHWLRLRDKYEGRAAREFMRLLRQIKPWTNS